MNDLFLEKIAALLGMEVIDETENCSPEALHELNMSLAHPSGVNRYKVTFKSPVIGVKYVRFYNSWKAAEQDSNKLEDDNWEEVTIHRIY